MNVDGPIWTASNFVPRSMVSNATFRVGARRTAGTFIRAASGSAVMMVTPACLPSETIDWINMPDGTSNTRTCAAAAPGTASGSAANAAVVRRIMRTWI